MFLDEPPDDQPAQRRSRNGDRSRKTTLVEYGFHTCPRWTTARSKFEVPAARTPGGLRLNHAGGLREGVLGPDRGPVVRPQA